MKDWHSSFARRIGVSGIEYTPAGVGQTLHIECSHGHLADVRVEKRMPQEAVVKKMLRAGWTLGHKLTCPDCQRKPKSNGACGTQAPPKKEDAVVAAEAKQPGIPPGYRMCADGKVRFASPGRAISGVSTGKIVEALTGRSNLTITDLALLTGYKPVTLHRRMKMLFEEGVVARALGEGDHDGHRPYLYTLSGAAPAEPKEDPMPEVTPTSISEQARTARRLATMMIDEKFDIERGIYRDGYSDSRVATETGVAESWVAQRREEEFGPLKTPPEFAEVFEKLDAFQRSLDEFNAEMVRENAARSKNVTDLREGLATLRREVTAVMRKNGWA